MAITRHNFIATMGAPSAPGVRLMLWSVAPLWKSGNLRRIEISPCVFFHARPPKALHVRAYR
jgi:hypothetical protein